MKKTTPKICLNMIVKQEAKTITRCLDSVLPYITTWCIVDTGSTDGTQDIIKSYFADKKMPGQLHERTWKDFGANRTEAIALALAMPYEKDYLFVMDADDTLVVTDPKWHTQLADSAYLFPFTMGGAHWSRVQLFRAEEGWKYKGVLHETLVGPEGHTTSRTNGVYIEARSSSVARAGFLMPQDKYLHDANVFRKAMSEMTEQDDPSLWSRYHFYCAQSYRDAHSWEESLEWYTRRAELGGWDEEVYYSLYMCAKLKETLERPEDEVIGAYMLAWQSRPTRLEAAYNLVRYLTVKRRNFLAWNLARTAIEAPPTSDILFVEKDVWAWRLANEWNTACYNVGKVKEAMKGTEALVNSAVFQIIEPSVQAIIKKNLALFQERYAAGGTSPSKKTLRNKHNTKKATR